MKKILVVDDDSDIREMITLVLRSNGYEVSALDDVEDLPAELAANLPDLLILDVMFPENSTAGFDACRTIKADPRYAELPVIMLSAINETYNMAFSDRNASSPLMPASRFVEKPVDPDELIKIVGELL